MWATVVSGSKHLHTEPQNSDIAKQSKHTQNTQTNKWRQADCRINFTLQFLPAPSSLAQKQQYNPVCLVSWPKALIEEQRFWQRERRRLRWWECARGKIEKVSVREREREDCYSEIATSANLYDTTQTTELGEAKSISFHILSAGGETARVRRVEISAIADCNSAACKMMRIIDGL